MYVPAPRSVKRGWCRKPELPWISGPLMERGGPEMRRPETSERDPRPSETLGP